jgi:hypothetical protein
MDKGPEVENSSPKAKDPQHIFAHFGDLFSRVTDGKGSGAHLAARRGIQALQGVLRAFQRSRVCSLKASLKYLVSPRKLAWVRANLLEN